MPVGHSSRLIRTVLIVAFGIALITPALAETPAETVKRLEALRFAPDVLFDRGELKAAAAAYREALTESGLDAESAAVLRYRLGFALFRAGDITGAERELEDADRRLTSAGGVNHPFRIGILIMLRAAFSQTGRYDRAQDRHTELTRLMAALSDSWAEAGGGALLHKQSGAVFPARLSDFSRGEATTFVLDGSDVAMGYDGPGGALTIYVTAVPPGQAQEDEFRMAAQEALKFNPGAVVKGAGPVSPWEGGPPPGGLLLTFAYVNPQNKADTASALALFETKGWFVKFRHTYPAVAEGEAQAGTKATMEGIGWPTRPPAAP